MIRQAHDIQAIILAAHGSLREANVNERIQLLAEQILKRGDFDEVVATFHQGEPDFCDVLDEVRADRVFVVPLMTSEGYYATEKLPADLALNPRFEKISVVQTRPVGTHPLLAQTIANRVRQLASDHLAKEDDITLALIGHGTPKNVASRRATETTADALRQRMPLVQVLTAYLDDQPPIESVMARATNKSVIVIPFLIGGGTHAVRDLPIRLGLTIESGQHVSTAGLSNGKRILIDKPVGHYPEIADWIIQLAHQAAKES